MDGREKKMSDISIFVSWCHRCGTKCEGPGRTDILCPTPGCGAVHDREWPAVHQIGSDGEVSDIKSSIPKTVS